MDIAEFCREIEIHLCKKNDGHLIRVVGPSFDLVSRWAEQGIPIKVATAGIDRYFERYYRSGPRRRPVKIDFCEHDVLDVFDEWRRATGITGMQPSAPDAQPTEQSAVRGRGSLPEHLERVVTKLSSARASGAIGEEFDPIIDDASHELDVVRAKAGGVRGEARAQLRVRLAEIDRAMIALARARVDGATLAQLDHEAAHELAPFKAGMAADAFARAHEAAVNHLVRARLDLPIIAFD